MRKCIYTLSIKNRPNDIFDICTATHKQYAEKCGVDFLVRHAVQDYLMSNNVDYENIIMEKFYIHELLNYYDRILYLDADVFIKSNSPNIFNHYADVDKFYIYNEVCYNNVEYDAHIEMLAQKHGIKWSKNQNGHYDFYNAGVMLVSKSQKEVFAYNKNEYIKFEKLPMIVDEPYLQANIYKHNVDVFEMEERFNTMCYFHENGDFLHFANVLDRAERIKRYA